MSVKAMKAGAIEFLTKPFDADDLLNASQQAVSGTHSEELETKNESADVVGESRALRAVLSRIHLVAPGLAALQNYNWPGNIRELRNVIERAMIVARGGTMEFDLHHCGGFPHLHRRLPKLWRSGSF